MDLKSVTGFKRIILFISTIALLISGGMAFSKLFLLLISL